ncbi:MAG: segregation/condensation protein A [Synergistaceae bacterium]|nr:segregation/condensation protein A [Synergistaceae bacterium]
MPLNDFEIDIDGYSGPFDLLCSLVEGGKFQTSGIKISQLIRIYGLYLVKSRQAPADTLAEFFNMTAGLVLEKTHSLLPGSGNEAEDDEPDEMVFMKSLERYRPYRDIYLWLSDKLALQAQCYRRGVQELQEDTGTEIEKEIIIDGSGAYLLGKTWREIQERYEHSAVDRENLSEAEAKADWDGFSGDDQKQIEIRVSEVEAFLRSSKSLSLREIAGKNLVVTLLAVLELCRMGKAYIEQDELFGDVRVITKD